MSRCLQQLRKNTRDRQNNVLSKVELGSKTWPFFRNFSISKFSNHFSATRPVMRAALTDRKLQFHSPMPRSINLCHENCIAPRFGSRKKMMWCVSVRKLCRDLAFGRKDIIGRQYVLNHWRPSLGTQWLGHVEPWPNTLQNKLVVSGMKSTN